MGYLERYGKMCEVLTWTKDEIRQYQAKKIKELLAHVYEKSEYYRDFINSTGKTLDELKLTDLPLIDKDIFYNNYSKIVCDPQIKQEELEAAEGTIYLGKYHVVHSSGSCGKPRYYLYDHEANETIMLALLRSIFHTADKKSLVDVKNIQNMLYIAEIDGAFGGVMMYKDIMDLLHTDCNLLSIQEPLHRWKEIMDKKPGLIAGYASALKILLSLDCDLDYSPDRIISCGEPLTPQLRIELEEKFHCPVINLYSCSESLMLGVEFIREDDVYLWEDLVYTEIIDHKLYITNLYNFEQPLIRYYLGDTVMDAKEMEQPKYQLKRISSPRGRDEDIMWFENGEKKKQEKDFLHPLSLDLVTQKGLIDYQFVKTSEKSFKIDIIVAQEKYQNNVKNALKQMVESVLNKKEMDYVSYDIDFVQSIPVDVRTGKKKLIRLAY